MKIFIQNTYIHIPLVITAAGRVLPAARIPQNYLLSLLRPTPPTAQPLIPSTLPVTMKRRTLLPSATHSTEEYHYSHGSIPQTSQLSSLADITLLNLTSPPSPAPPIPSLCLPELWYHYPIILTTITPLTRATIATRKSVWKHPQ